MDESAVEAEEEEYTWNSDYDINQYGYMKGKLIVKRSVIAADYILHLLSTNGSLSSFFVWNLNILRIYQHIRHRVKLKEEGINL